MSSTPHRGTIRPEAQAEIAEAAGGYESHRRGLGRAFVHTFRAAAAVVGRNPLLYPEVLRQAGRVVLRRLAYPLIYEVHGDEVVVLACMHGARDPEEWRRRVGGA